MKTWIKCDYIFARTEETKFLQELVLSGNLDMVKAIECNSLNRATNFTERKVVNFINSIKRAEEFKIFYVSIDGSTSTLDPKEIANADYNIGRYFRSYCAYSRVNDVYKKERGVKSNSLYINYTVELNRYISTYNAIFRRDKKVKPLNLFSIGLYRVYKNEVYKAVNFYKADIPKLINYNKYLK